MAVLQFALVFAAPLSACCRTASVRAHGAIECCPPGAHAPGECPLHKGKRGADCAMRCDNTSAPGFILGTIGLLPRPASAPVDSAHVRATHIASSPTIISRTLLPDAPPPKSL